MNEEAQKQAILALSEVMDSFVTHQQRSIRALEKFSMGIYATKGLISDYNGKLPSDFVFLFNQFILPQNEGTESLKEALGDMGADIQRFIEVAKAIGNNIVEDE